MGTQTESDHLQGQDRDLDRSLPLTPQMEPTLPALIPELQTPELQKKSSVRLFVLVFLRQVSL